MVQRWLFKMQTRFLDFESGFGFVWACEILGQILTFYPGVHLFVLIFFCIVWKSFTLSLRVLIQIETYFCISVSCNLL